MKNIFSNHEPVQVWHYFEEICTIPRPSKKEAKIIQYLEDFAAQFQLSFKKDCTGNVLITKPAKPGMENKPILVLQSHLDMVCEKNESTIHNFETDPLEIYIENGWVKAKGTTLGADDGIGIAAQLAILASNDISHGQIECLFTVDEETGLTGAYNLQPNFFTGKILLNLDSEEEGVIFIGCAGGMDTTGRLHVETIDAKTDSLFYRISVSGLIGGHSGDDINKGLGNAIKIITRLAYCLYIECNIEISLVEGGNLRNAIPREAFLEFAISNMNQQTLFSAFESLSNKIKDEFRFTEKNLEISILEMFEVSTVLHQQSGKNLLNLIYGLPHGPMGMSRKIKGLVETSTNLASVKRENEDIYVIGTSQRSSSDSLKKDIANKVESVFKLSGANFEHSTGYPGWEPNPESRLLKNMVADYQQLFSKEPIVTSIHAGLECGLFLAKYPGLEMVSFGPTIYGAHSPDERIEIESVNRFWRFLLEIVKCF